MVDNPTSIVNILGEIETDQAVNTLVRAFRDDPVARWMYSELQQYHLHIPLLFQALAASSFAAGTAQRTDDGIGVALWLPPGVHSDDGRLAVVIAETIHGKLQAEVSTLFERTDHYRPAEPHWYLSLIGVATSHQHKGRGSALLRHGLRECDLKHQAAYLWSSNPRNTTLYGKFGFEVMDTIQVGSSPPIFPMLRRAR
jgi:ribosomal protein S18 acetylase RimI-like enzyme